MFSMVEKNWILHFKIQVGKIGVTISKKLCQWKKIDLNGKSNV